jgi:ubiquinone biosynthesis UbiH/UbiF/VisC/COQ6 family hydroxylase
VSSEAQFDVAVVGSGLAGAAAVRALCAASPGARIAWVAPEGPAVSGEAEGFDVRVYAISPGNAAFLARLGAWERIAPARLAPVRAMRVVGDDGGSMLEFDAYRSGVAALAWIVEERRLQQALWQGLESLAGLTLYGGAALQEFRTGEARAELLLQDGRRLAARLVVGADGARSPVRTQAGIAVQAEPYGMTAVVANFACTRPHGDAARQWFQGAAQGGAILALLPLPGDHVSMVWSTTAAEAARLLALDAAALAREVAASSCHAVGDLEVVTPPRGHPLQRLAAARLVAPRVALAGDAAHVVHPLAGQGINLGLQDVQALAQVLGAAEPGRDPGDLRLLRRYERARAEPILAMRATVHGLFRLFDAPGPAAARLRNAGLALTHRLPIVKNHLIRHAMG